jgi:WavE lipopolysaccharide synthesis protein
MLPIDAQQLGQAYARLYSRTARVIGWGTGSAFDYFNGLHPIRLDYLVDNDPTRWGQQRRGIEIAAPERLVTEVPADTVIVIYSSSWMEIRDQIARMGDFIAIPASVAFLDASVREKLSWVEAIVERPGKRRPSAVNTIVVQGPVMKGVTAYVLRILAALNPHDLVLLSTWNDTDPALLDEVSPIADDVVTSARPPIAGVQNRNLQIVSTRAGVERAIELGARTILKTRTDLAILSQSVFLQAGRWLQNFDASRARSLGLHDRLIVPSNYTRKYLLYHPSDLAMLGAAEDLALYWSAPLDPRSGELHSVASPNAALSAVNLAGHPAESYLGLEFCRTLGRPVTGTLVDSWMFYRDLFAVVDNDWFDLLWFKNLSIPDATCRSGVRQLVTSAFWQRLFASDPLIERDLLELNPSRIALGALAGAA